MSILLVGLGETFSKRLAAPITDHFKVTVKLEHARIQSVLNPNYNIAFTTLFFLECLWADIFAFIQKLGIKIEQMDTLNAITTFNILNAEDRPVAAALLKLDPDDPPPGYYS